ncbi:MAG: T9SS type A sorting domain-containing protein [Bacteroidota bacterium]
MRKIIFFLMSMSSILRSQHSVPFASTNNTIELAVANSSLTQADNISVEVTQKPSWLILENSQVNISKLNANETSTAPFAFSIDKSAPVNKPEQILITISNPRGEQWTKTLSLQVSPPEKCELFQNYPNPFNPSTMISYQLPVISNVSLKIYDAIGREVATLDEGVKEAGYHQNEWNAVNVSSGMYVYQLSYKDEKGEQKSYRKKMLVMK